MRLGQEDAFYHRYLYDAENRITHVLTSADSINWDNDAFYQYYNHGPLARTVLGEQQVQGVNYAYKATALIFRILMMPVAIALVKQLLKHPLLLQIQPGTCGMRRAMC